jgi:hypothetical protein
MKTVCVLSCAAFGLFLGAPQSRADTCGVAGNLVANCGFESSLTFTSWTVSGIDTPGGEGNLYGVEAGADLLDGISPHGGTNQAFFADLVPNSTTISQNIATSISQEYAVQFYLAQDTTPTSADCGGTPCTNKMVVSFGGVTLSTLNAVPVEGYTLYSFTTIATSTSSALSLTLGNTPGQFLLDDISVSAVPEPISWVLMLSMMAGCVIVRKFRSRKQAR